MHLNNRLLQSFAEQNQETITRSYMHNPNIVSLGPKVHCFAIRITQKASYYLKREWATPSRVKSCPAYSFL